MCLVVCFDYSVLCPHTDRGYINCQTGPERVLLLTHAYIHMYTFSYTLTLSSPVYQVETLCLVCVCTSDLSQPAELPW